jgi:endonuclease/exonuclease/phosphatase family metal-dependent hydrolase
MIRVASYNIHKCVGTDGKFDPLRIIDVLAEVNADVVALQEADSRFGERKGLLDLAALHQKTGLTPVKPEGAQSNHGWHGNVVLVRQAEVHDTHALKLPGVEPRGAFVVDMEAKAQRLRVIATHFGLLRRSRTQQVETVLNKAKAAEGRTVVVMGDLNEWRVGRRSALVGLEQIFGPLINFVPSFPAAYPLLALDRILCRPHQLLQDIRVHDSQLAKKASDHLPVTAEIVP